MYYEITQIEKRIIGGRGEAATPTICYVLSTLGY